MSEDHDRDPSIPQSFETLGEHYRLKKKLGEGAFGVVYEAHHTLLDQAFAVKILKPELCEDEDLRERFLDEARALIRFSHTNVVQLRHVGEHHGRLYLVMDLVEGEALNDLLQREGSLGEARSVEVMLQVLAGLEAAHEAGIVHRDLKPSNLIVNKQGDRLNVRILDFGLSKLSVIDGAEGARRSVTGAIIGTLAYMSPEQLSGEAEIDARSDIFAAGLVFHEMLEGQHPYPGDSGIVVAAKLLRESVPDIQPKVAAKLRPSTLASLRQALERDRDARFSSAVAFSQALEGKGPPSDTSRVTTIQEARETLAREEAKRARTTRAGAAKKKKVGLLVGALVVVLAAVGVFLAMQSGSDEPSGGTVIADNPSRDAPETDPTPTPARVDPDPEPQPTTVDPEPTPPVAVETVPTPPEPVDPVPTPPPAEETTAEDAKGLAAEGRWAKASEAWRVVLAAEPKNVEALRGGAMTALVEADTRARRGDLDGALTSLDGTVTWLAKQYSEIYEPGNMTDAEGMRLPSGFTLMHRGEAHTERGRWLRVKGDLAGSKAALALAKADIALAWQFLERDGENYWDLLLRRATYRQLTGDPRGALDDLALTTQIDSELVPPRMWVAHFTGLRRQAERVLLLSRPGRNMAARPAAVKMAQRASELVRKAESWTRRRGEAFSRAQWLEAARVLLINHVALKPDADRTQIHGLMKWYLEQARAQPVPAWESVELGLARILPLEAGLALMHAAVLEGQGKTAEAEKRRLEALEQARKAVALREKVAADGGELPAPCPYALLARVCVETGRADEAAQAVAKVRESAKTNPE